MEADAFKVLVDSMEAFLRVPKVTFDEWCDLDEDQKAALLIAAQRIETERIVQIATAVRSEMGILSVAKNLDGGDQWVRANIHRAIDRYASALGKR